MLSIFMANNVISYKKIQKKRSKNPNRWFYYVNSAPELRNDQKSPIAVSKKCISQNLRNWACKLKSLRPLDYEKKWFKFGSSNSKIDTSDLILLHSPNFGQPKQGPNFFFEFFFIFFRNPECVRIFWVYAPKNFPIENFWVRSDLRKSSIFSLISVSSRKITMAVCCGLNFDATDLPNG